jgi:hypothetical protein
MGFDRLLTFFNKNLPNVSEELFDIPHVVANHIFFDMNFLVYNSINEIEEEINKIIMIIVGVSFTDINIINSKLKTIFNGYHWKEININMGEILDGNNIQEIIDNFKTIITTNSIKLLTYHVYNKLNHHIINTHNINFIKTINIFFDGIPTYSKILEQRRRRMKNYLDSKNRKQLFNKYFDNIINTVIIEDEVTFDYFDWINNMYSFDKSIGPYSTILIEICSDIEKKMTKAYNNIKIYVDKSTNYGESDYKIFKHILDHKLDCLIAIHSCDSDFIFLLIWFQLILTSKNIDVSLVFINYINSKNEKHLFYGKKLINSIVEKYGSINNITDNISINIIYDLLALLILFGSDIMPENYEIGPELSMKHIFECHYILYIDSTFVINLNSECVINFINLGKWLQNIKNTNSFSTVILNRFYKIPYNIINNIDKYKTIDEVINQHLIPNKIEYNHMLINKSFFIEKNGYQSLYNYICNEANNLTDDIFNRPSKAFFDNLEDSYIKYKKISGKNVSQYLNLFVSLNQIYFFDFNLYTPFNILYYEDNIAPSIDDILKFINNNDMNKFQLNSLNKLSCNKNNYFNPISHHLFITPYLLDKNYLLEFANIKYIESLLNVIGKNIKGIWFEHSGANFNLKHIDPILFINLCNMLIKFYQDNFIDRFFIDNSKLIK